MADGQHETIAVLTGFLRLGTREFQHFIHTRELVIGLIAVLQYATDLHLMILGLAQ